MCANSTCVCQDATTDHYHIELNVAYISITSFFALRVYASWLLNSEFTVFPFHSRFLHKRHSSAWFIPSGWKSAAVCFLFMNLTPVAVVYPWCVVTAEFTQGLTLDKLDCRGKPFWPSCWVVQSLCPLLKSWNVQTGITALRHWPFANNYAKENICHVWSNLRYCYSLALRP